MSDLTADTRDDGYFYDDRLGSFKKGKKNSKSNFNTDFDIEGEESDPDELRGK